MTPMYISTLKFFRYRSIPNQNIIGVSRTLALVCQVFQFIINDLLVSNIPANLKNKLNTNSRTPKNT